MKREETERHNKEMENNIRNIKKLQIGSGLKKKQEIKPLTNYDIINAGKNVKNFRGCFMKDELPAVPWKNECGILNLNNSNQSGSHWVAWLKNDNKNSFCF